MQTVALLAVLALVASHVATADVVRHGSMPDVYRGTWTGAGTEPEKSAIVLSVKTYVSREATCRVDWVSQTAGARGSIYCAHLQCLYPADGAVKKPAANLIIWPDGINRIAAGCRLHETHDLSSLVGQRQLPRDRVVSDDTNLDATEIGSDVESRSIGGM